MPYDAPYISKTAKDVGIENISLDMLNNFMREISYRYDFGDAMTCLSHYINNHVEMFVNDAKYMQRADLSLDPFRYDLNAPVPAYIAARSLTKQEIAAEWEKRNSAKFRDTHFDTSPKHEMKKQTTKIQVDCVDVDGNNVFVLFNNGDGIAECENWDSVLKIVSEEKSWELQWVGNDENKPKYNFYGDDDIG